MLAVGFAFWVDVCVDRCCLSFGVVSVWWLAGWQLRIR